MTGVGRARLRDPSKLPGSPGRRRFRWRAGQQAITCAAAGLRSAFGVSIPGALSILTGAVPDRARGLGHMAPTYFGREPGIEHPDGSGGSALPPH